MLLTYLQGNVWWLEGRIDYQIAGVKGLRSKIWGTTAATNWFQPFFVCSDASQVSHIIISVLTNLLSSVT